MGMVGGYECHLYCDCCKEFWDITEFETAAAARQLAREHGWKFKKNGDVICGACDETDAPTLPEEDREGGNWKNYG